MKQEIYWDRGYYYETGKLWYEIPILTNGDLFNCGQEHGISREYYKNGKLKSEVLFVNGKERPDLLNNKLARVVLFGAP